MYEKMNYDERLALLKSTHSQLKKELISAKRRGIDESIITEMKKNKLYVKDMIEKMEITFTHHQERL